MRLFSKKRQNFHEIIILLIGAVIWNQLVYNGAKLIAKNWHHHDMTLSVDAFFPFVPWTVVIYFGCYLFWVVNYYICAHYDKPERDRFFCADFISKGICLIFFLSLPTTNIRPDVSNLDGIDGFLMNFLYHIDSADNLFPSIHCLVSWLCWIGVRNRKDIPAVYRNFSLAMALAVCISTLTTRQHVIVDVFGGVLLAEICYLVAKIPKVCGIYSKMLSCVCGLFKKRNSQKA